MRIVFFGTPDFAVPSLKALIQSGQEVVLVVTQPDRKKGRGHQLSSPPVKDMAVEHHIRVIQPTKIRTAEFAQEISSFEPDAIVVVAYGRIIPPSILKIPAYGCINVHASLLPKYRGAAPIQWSIISGDKVTGITTMLMDEGLDTGDILFQEETVITDDDTALSLGDRLSQIGGGLLIKTLDGLKSGSVTSRPQTGEPSFARILVKEDGRIDWRLPSLTIFNHIRGMYPWPGAFCFLNREKIEVLHAAYIEQDKYDCRPGRLNRISGDIAYVCTGDGLISLIDVKPEGKKPMTAAAFLRGRHIKEGVSFDAA